MSENNLQRTEKWFKTREGRFTASQINRLLGKETLKTTKQSIDTYAFEKAVETLYGVEEDSFVSFDMQRGIALEPLAFRVFEELKKFEFLDVQKTGFIPFGEHAGSSPDGIIKGVAPLEIKCPRRNKFMRIVANGIEEIDEVYMSQMQMQMLCTNTEKCYFFNYSISPLQTFQVSSLLHHHHSALQIQK